MTFWKIDIHNFSDLNMNVKSDIDFSDKMPSFDKREAMLSALNNITEAKTHEKEMINRSDVEFKMWSKACMLTVEHFEEIDVTRCDAYVKGGILSGLEKLKWKWDKKAANILARLSELVNIDIENA